MSCSSLNDVKTKLYEVFNEAVEKQAYYGDPSKAKNGGEYGGGDPENFAIQNRIAIGAIAQAIAAVEHEQHEAEESKAAKLDKPVYTLGSTPGKY